MQQSQRSTLNLDLFKVITQKVEQTIFKWVAGYLYYAYPTVYSTVPL